MPVETPEGRMFAGVMTYPYGLAELLIEPLLACDCGCSRTNRIAFTIGKERIVITDPAAIDAVIEKLRNSRQELWGEPR